MKLVMICLELNVTKTYWNLTVSGIFLENPEHLTQLDFQILTQPGFLK
jgi:hypothetical protein